MTFMVEMLSFTVLDMEELLLHGPERSLSLSTIERLRSFKFLSHSRFPHLIDAAWSSSGIYELVVASLSM